MSTLPPSMTRKEAVRVTEGIRVALDRVSQSWADLGERITDAYQRRADRALGYASWAEYAEAELRPTEGLAAEVRRQLVGMLSQAGMSTRAIAPTVGVTHPTVIADQRSGGKPLTTSISDRIDYATGEILTPAPSGVVHFEDGEIDTEYDLEDAAQEVREARASSAALAPSNVVGLDGKTYSRPDTPPAKPRRRPITDQALDAGWELRKVVERAERIVGDDRFTRNADEVARILRGHLIYAAEATQRLLRELPTNTSVQE